LKVTALEEYGLRCMLLFAADDSGLPLTLPEVSSKEGLSVPYAGKLMAMLKQAGLVKAVRGRSGGYVIAKPAEKIALKEILSALGESFYGQHHCDRYTRKEDCVHEGDCTVGSVWIAFDQFIDQVLQKVTLADLASGKFDLLGAVESEQ
jgi:Rrf2 family iron-sulfur cluster assembly transcriptional regulator